MNVLETKRERGPSRQRSIEEMQREIAGNPSV